MIEYNTKGIRPGDEVMFVHDVLDFKVGDRAEVFGYCVGCGKLVLQGSQHHYDEADLVKFVEGDVKHVDPNKIDKQKVVNLVNDMIKGVFMNQRQGSVPVDVVGALLKYQADKLGLTDELQKPFN